MSDRPIAWMCDLSQLRLEPALQLLQQAGVTLPDRATDPTGWMQHLLDALCDLSSRDPLTGLLNRRTFEAVLAREIDRVARNGDSALLLMLDIDHFKRVNDTHGHAVGDEVIRHVAQLIRQTVRPMDTVARIGGEEFAVVLPSCSTADGATVAERIRQRVAQLQVEVPSAPPLRVTLSLGGAFAPQWVRSSNLIWMERADRQLYKAKAAGRDRACLERQVESVVSAEEKGLLFAFTHREDVLEGAGPATDSDLCTAGEAP